MLRSWPLLLLTLLLSAVSLSAAPALPAPRIIDLRAWHYASGPEDRAQTLMWWQPEGMRVQRQGTLSRSSLVRVRVLVSGGIAEDDEGTVNWLSLVFRDQQGAEFELPPERRATRAGTKDILWRIPPEFAAGPLELEVLAWSERSDGPSRSMTPADRSGWLKLGRVVD